MTVEDDRRRRIQMEFERAKAQAEADAAAARERTGQAKPDPMTLGGAAKAAASGVRSGIEMLPGMAGDVPELMGKGASWLSRRTGIGDPEAAGGAVEAAASGPLSNIAKVLQAAGIISPETGGMVQASVRPTTRDIEAVTDFGVNQLPESVAGPVQDVTRYQPTNALERGIFTGGTMLPNMVSGGGGVLSRFTRGVVAPTVGSEVGGAVGEKLGYPILGKLAGGIAGAATPAGVSRVLAGPQLGGERARLVQALTDRGIDLTAGQASGREALKYAEVGPFASKPGRFAEMQGEQFNRAALQEAGINADRVSLDTVLNARDDFGRQYDAVIQQTGGLPIDHQMTQDLVTLVDDYKRLKQIPPGVGNSADHYLRRISDAEQAGGGRISTEDFQQIRSDIAKDLRRLRDDPTQSQMLRDFQDALYGSIERNSPPGTEAIWRDLNRQYRNFKLIEKSMLGPGAATAEGMISPSKLRTAVAGADPSGFLGERGDLDTLAKAGEATMKPLPQSGTTPRALVPGALGSAATAFLTGHPWVAAAGLGSALAGPIIAGTLTSGPVRRGLIRNITGQGPDMINPMVAALLARQAAQQGDQTRR